MAVFLAGIMFIVGHALPYFGRSLLEGSVFEAMGVVGLGALIPDSGCTDSPDGPTAGSRHLPEVTPGTPYRVASAKITPEFVTELANLEHNLQRSAVEEGWSIEWAEHNLVFESAKTALSERRHTESLRDFARAIHILMGGIHLLRKQRDQLVRWGTRPYSAKGGQADEGGGPCRSRCRDGHRRNGRDEPIRRCQSIRNRSARLSPEILSRHRVRRLPRLCPASEVRAFRLCPRPDGSIRKTDDREVCVLFTRTIRRKLLLGVGLVMGMLLILSVSAISALNSYRDVIRQLYDDITVAPQQVELVNAAGAIFEPLLWPVKNRSPAMRPSYGRVHRTRTRLDQQQKISGFVDRHPGAAARIPTTM